MPNIQVRTTFDNGHMHLAVINESGNGQTISTVDANGEEMENDHTHKIGQGHIKHSFHHRHRIEK